MYHRFDEQKYPSTNINMNIFKKHMEMIKNSNITFLNPIDLKVEINKANKNKLILLTIDDGYTSFYKNYDTHLIEDFNIDKIILSAAHLSAYGWKKEAIPITQTKNSLITRIFKSLFG